MKSKRVSKFADVAAELLQLRRDEIGMDELRPLIRAMLYRRALYFFNRWKTKQTLYGVDDLYSMGEVAVWRAVDTWDPSKRPIEDYVDCEVGRAMEKPLKAAAGYPDPRRSEPAAQSYFADIRLQEVSHQFGSRMTYWVDHAAELVLHARYPERQDAQDEQMQRLERLQYALGVCEGLKDEFGRLVLRLVLEGYTINSAAEAMYGSKRLRTYYRLRSVEHAKKAAHAAAVRVRREVAAHAA